MNQVVLSTLASWPGVQLFSALEGSHRENPWKDLSVGQDLGEGLISGTFRGRSGWLATMHVFPTGPIPRA